MQALALAFTLLLAPAAPRRQPLPPPILIHGLPRVIWVPVYDAPDPRWMRLVPHEFVYQRGTPYPSGERIGTSRVGLRSRLRYRWLAFRMPDTGEIHRYPEYYFAR